MLLVLLLQESAQGAGYALGQMLAFLLAGALYLLPAWLGRKKRQATPIALLALLLGWTGIGWIAALIWAVSADNARPAANRAV